MDIHVAFWNLGNLFDTLHDPISDDFDFTPAAGWTEETQAAKVANLAAVIDLMFDGAGPDLLGVCEVENEPTLQQLIEATQFGSELEVLEFEDGPDIRGIDCSLVYRKEVFEPLPQADPPAPASHVVHNRYPTRDIFEAVLKVKENGAELIVYVNHWPSRYRGRYETDPLRVAAANHLGRLIDRRLKRTREEFLAMDDTEDSMNALQAQWNRNVLAMGDFNDEPFNRSILEELKASSGFDRLEEPLKKARANQHLPRLDAYYELQAPLFNCMWPLTAVPDRGSYWFGQGFPTRNVLDQFIVSRGLYYGESKLKMKRRTQLVRGANEGDPPVEQALDTVWADVFDPDLMITSTTTRRPKRFTFSCKNGVPKHNNGFSDHFPIVTIIEVL